MCSRFKVFCCFVTAHPAAHTASVTLYKNLSLAPEVNINQTYAHLLVYRGQESGGISYISLLTLAHRQYIHELAASKYNFHFSRGLFHYCMYLCAHVCAFQYVCLCLCVCAVTNHLISP